MAAIPTLIQYSCSSEIFTGGSDPPLGVNSKFYVYLPNPSLAGNCLIVSCKGEASATAVVTVTDDKSNTWVQGVKHTDTTNGATVHIWYAVNCAAGTRKISIQNTDSATMGFFTAMCAEFNNIETSSNAAAKDTSTGNHGTSSSATAGSITPGTSGDLVFMGVACDNGHASSYTAGTNTNISWKLLRAERNEGYAWQWGIYNSTSSINPTMTMGSSVGFSTAALFLKPSTNPSGTPQPNSIWVIGIQAFSMPSSVSNPTLAVPNPYTIQCPCYGNLMVGAFSSGSPDRLLTRIQDSNGSDWNQLGSGITNFTNADRNHDDSAAIWYRDTHTPSDSCTLTLTHNSVATNDSTIKIYDIVNANSEQDIPERSASATGLDSGGGSASLTTVTITPVKTGGLIIACTQQETSTETDVTGPTGALFDSNFYDDESHDGPQNIDQNGGWMHYYNNDILDVTVVWTFVTTGAKGAWAAYAGSFLPAPVRAKKISMAQRSDASYW